MLFEDCAHLNSLCRGGPFLRTTPYCFQTRAQAKSQAEFWPNLLFLLLELSTGRLTGTARASCCAFPVLFTHNVYATIFILWARFSDQRSSIAQLRSVLHLELLESSNSRTMTETMPCPVAGYPIDKNPGGSPRGASSCLER